MDKEDEFKVYGTATAYLEGSYSIQDLKDIIEEMEEENKKFRKAVRWTERKKVTNQDLNVNRYVDVYEGE